MTAQASASRFADLTDVPAAGDGYWRRVGGAYSFVELSPEDIGALTNFLRSGTYFGANGTVNTTTPVAMQMIAIPIFLPRAVTFDRIACEVTTLAAGAVVRLGIYDDDGNGYPGNLILDAGTVDAATTGFKEIVIAQAVARGLCWFASVSQGGAPTLRSTSAVFLHSLVAETLQTASQNTLGGFSQTLVGGALPAAFSAAMVARASCPKVMVRVV